MKVRTLALAGLLAVVGTSADAIEVKKQLPVSGSPEAIWRIASEFCSIKDWHPDFSGCTQSMKNGVVWRVLTLKEGAKPRCASASCQPERDRAVEER